MAEAKKREGTFSGGPVKDFTEGWAVLPFRGSKAHYWRDITEKFQRLMPDAQWKGQVVESECRLVGPISDRVPALGAGDTPLCKRCIAKAGRWTTKEERQTFLETVPGAREYFA